MKKPIDKDSIVQVPRVESNQSPNMSGNPRQYEEKYRAIFQQVRDGIVLIDGETGFINDCNPQFEKQTGRKLKQLKKIHIWDVRPPEKIEAARNKYYEILAKGHGTSSHLEYQKPNGQIVPIEFWAKRINLDEEQYILSVTRDLSDLRQLEEELDLERNKYQFFFDEAENGLAILTATKSSEKIIYIDVNKRMTELLGYTKKEFLRLSPFDLVSPQVASKWKAEILNKREVEHARIVHDYLKKNGQKITLEVDIHILWSKNLIFSIYRDISKRIEYENKLIQNRKKEEELRKQIEKQMQSRIQYTRALVHELRTPLTPLLGMSSLLLKRLKDPQNIKITQCINAAGIKLNRRIGELLDLAKGEMGLLELKCHWVDIGEELNDLFDSFSAQAEEKGYIFENCISPHLPLIMVDMERFRHVVLNLLNNAIKYTKSGTKIIIGASVESNKLSVVISDNGPGMNEKQLERLFEPYQKFEADRGRLDGLGLGLSLSKQLIELHGGKIWVRSKKGKGSQFFISMPLTNKTERNEKYSNKQ